MASGGNGNPLSPGSGAGNGSGLGGGPSIAGSSSPSPNMSMQGGDGAGQQGRPRVRGDAPQSQFQGVHDTLKQVNAQYKQGQRMQKALDDLRVEMDELMDLGDIVTPDDVIAAAGRLVGKGLEADQMATILSGMPTTGGQGLAAWVRMHDMTVRRAELQTQAQLDQTRARMGIAGIRSIAALDVETDNKRTAEARAAMAGRLAPSQGATPAPAGGGLGIQPTSVIQMEQSAPSGGGGGQ